MANKTLYLFLLLVALCDLSCNSGSGHREALSNSKNGLKGRVIGIVDGDTYEVLMDGNNTTRVRMEGIDAPEKGMPLYKTAKKYLSSLCFGKQVTVKKSGTDKYNRIIAFSYLEDGRELSHEMLKAGLAWHFKKYNADSNLANLETDARNAKIGIWQMNNPMAPWDNRSLHRNGISTKDSFDLEATNE